VAGQRRVFVCGTLKDGFPNFHVNRGRRVPGEYRAEQRYPLDWCWPTWTAWSG